MQGLYSIVRGVQTLAIRLFLWIRHLFLWVRYWRHGLNHPSVNWVLLVGPPVLLVKKKILDTPDHVKIIGNSSISQCHCQWVAGISYYAMAIPGARLTYAAIGYAYGLWLWPSPRLWNWWCKWQNVDWQSMLASCFSPTLAAIDSAECNRSLESWQIQWLVSPALVGPSAGRVRDRVTFHTETRSSGYYRPPESSV